MASRSASGRRARGPIAFGWLGVASISGLVAAVGCEPDLGSEPFGCADGATCPDGYTCQATVCIADGEVRTVSRPLRVTYINRSEMYWFASPRGGATLVVNDGFSPGARGVYEIHVDPDGATTPPLRLLDSPGELPVSSAVVALDDGHYGVVTMSFPGALEDGLTVALHQLPREGSSEPKDVILHKEVFPFSGGYEPAYVGAVAYDDEVVYAFTDASSGGGVVITRVTKSGELIGDALRVDLPPGVLPLSGDCLLWRSPGGSLLLRVGLEDMHLFAVDLDAAQAVEIPAAAGIPIYGFDGAFAYLVPNGDATSATYAVRDYNGKLLGESEREAFSAGVEPHTAVGYGEGALIAPLSSDASFPTVDVGYVAPDGTFGRVASVERPGDDDLYTARAIAADGKAYVAWTSFHDQLMDVWVGVAPLEALP